MHVKTNTEQKQQYTHTEFLSAHMEQYLHAGILKVKYIKYLK